MSVFWNLFLAVIPVFLAFAIARGARRDMRATGRVRWGLWLPLGVVWLVFLPNSCYLLTEWRHYLETLTRSPLYAQAHQSRDGQLDFFITTGFYLFYSGAGLLAFFLAIWPLDRLTRRRLGWGGALLRPLIFPLCALGVYLGLTRDRFNTWDLVNAQKLTPILAMIGQVFHRPLALSMILLFGAVLWLFYAAFDIWMDGAAWRLARRHAREKDSHHASA
ncbi:MAG: DUF1361 domain-containing protein [Armatimonadota bacterium]|nr:DUF1361 domain-containing protein [Armatimonadota bacterium]